MVDLHIEGEGQLPPKIPSLTSQVRESIASGALDAIDDKLANQAAANQKVQEAIKASNAIDLNKDKPEEKKVTPPVPTPAPAPKEGEEPPKVEEEKEEKPLEPPTPPEEESEEAKFFRASGGKQVVEKAVQHYQTITRPPQEFNPKEVLDSIKAVSQPRYNAVIVEAFRNHGLEFVQDIFGLTPERLEEFVQWQDAGSQKTLAPDDEDEEELDEEEFDLSTKEGRKLAELMKERKESKKAEAERQKQESENRRKQQELQAKADKDRFTQAVTLATEAYEEDYIASGHSVINQLVAKGSLNDKDPNDLELIRCILARAQDKFISDPTDGTTYRQGLAYIRAGEPALAEALQPTVREAMARHTASVASYLLGLLQTKRDADSQKRQVAAAQVHVPSRTAVSPQANTVAADIHEKPLTKQTEAERKASRQSRLAELESKGIFGRI